MINLLRAEFKRMFKNNIFKLCICFVFLIPTLTLIYHFIDICDTNPLIKPPNPPNVEDMLFLGKSYLCVVMAIITGIFVGIEHHEGTFHNKLTVGHTRFDIYLSKFIVCVTVNIAMNLLSIGTAYVFRGTFFGFGDVANTTRILRLFVINVLSALHFTAIFLFISMLVRNMTFGSLSTIGICALMLAITPLIHDLLHNVEFYQDYSSNGTYYLVKNQDYVGGILREILLFIDKTLPTSQLKGYTITHGPTLSEFWFMLISDIVTSVAYVMGGWAIYNKFNLK